MTLPARRFSAAVGDSSNDLGNSGPAAISDDLTIPDQRTYDLVSPVHSNYGLATGGTASANTTAMNAAIADTLAGMTVLIPRGTYQVNAITWGSTNYTLQLDGILSLNAADTIPANVTVRVGQGGGFVRVAGDHLTINGQFSAGMHQVFTEATTDGDWVVFGSGFTGSAIPQWWGAKGDGVGLSGLNIQYTGAAATATVHVTSTSVVGTTDGAVDDFSITFAAQTTLTAMAAAIDAAANWTCTVHADATGTWKSSFIWRIAIGDAVDAKAPAAPVLLVYNDESRRVQQAVFSGRRTYCPPGTYYMDVERAYYPPTGYYASHYGAVVVIGTGKEITNDPQAIFRVIPNATNESTAVFVFQLASWLRFKGGMFYGDIDDHDYVTNAGTHETHCGLKAIGGSDSVISDCYFEDFPGDGIHLFPNRNRNLSNFSPMERLTISRVHVYQCRRQGISVGDTYDLRIEDSTFEKIGAEGTWPNLVFGPCYGIDLEGYATGGIRVQVPEKVVITGCRFIDNGYGTVGGTDGIGGDIDLLDSRFSVVSNCYFNGNVGVVSAYGARIENCIFDKGQTRSAFALTTSSPHQYESRNDVLVSGCVFTNYRTAIAIYDSIGIHVVDCTITDTVGTSANYAVDVYDTCSDILFLGNRIESTVGGLVAIRTGADVIFKNNRFLGSADLGAISLQASSSAEFDGNDFIDARLILSGTTARVVGNNFQRRSSTTLSYSLRPTSSVVAHISGNRFGFPLHEGPHIQSNTAFSGTAFINNNSFYYSYRFYVIGNSGSACTGTLYITDNNFYSNRDSNNGTLVVPASSLAVITGNKFFMLVSGRTMVSAIDTSTTTSAIIQGNYSPHGPIVAAAGHTVIDNVTSTQYPAQANPVLIGTVNASGDSYIYMAKQNITIERIDLVSSTGIASDATDYWTAQVANLTTAVNLLATAKSTNGNAVTADTIWSITPDQNATMATGNVLELQLTKFNAGPDWTRLMVVVHARNTQ